MSARRSSLTADDLRAIRAHLRLSQAKLAGVLGYTVRAVKRWEAGSPIPETVCIMLRLMRGHRPTALIMGARPPVDEPRAADVPPETTPTPKRDPFKMTIHEQLRNAGVPLDHHSSDLYAMKTPASQVIVDAYEWRKQVTEFRDQVAGGIWYDIPFAYHACFDPNAPQPQEADQA